jgi:diguanylate cyclase (GGDEF)-like protein/PAS domain S-box-containing protein
VRILLPEFSFEALCRMARALFAVSGASVRIDALGLRWLDLAPGLDQDAWAFLADPEGLPEAGQVMMWVENALEREAFAGLPAVSGGPGLRFIATAAFGLDGLGRLVLADTLPRAASPEALAWLADLGAIAGQCLGLHQAAQEALEREALFRLLAETSTDTIVRGDLDGVRLYISPSVRDLLGYEPEELVGRQAVDLTHPDDVPGFRALMQNVREGRLDVGVRELRQRHKNGSWVWMEASVRLTRDRVMGRANGYVASVRAIGRRKALEERLSRLASYDALTGLPNRTLFGQRLGEALSQTSCGRDFALFYLDLDGFKQVNDRLGHQAGDAVLCEAAARFRAVLRVDDAVARLGGDEFAVLLEVGSIEACNLAQRLIAAVSRPFAQGETTISIGLSVGIAFAPKDAVLPDELLSRADEALYAAKAAGRNTFCLFDQQAVRGL